MRIYGNQVSICVWVNKQKHRHCQASAVSDTWCEFSRPGFSCRIENISPNLLYGQQRTHIFARASYSNVSDQLTIRYRWMESGHLAELCRVHINVYINVYISSRVWEDDFDDNLIGKFIGRHIVRHILREISIQYMPVPHSAKCQYV